MPKCKLKKNNKIIPYDFCDDKKDTYKSYPIKLKYLGYGIIYSVNGVKQGYKMKDKTHLRHFFERK
jgi:hypothetical protein